MQLKSYLLEQIQNTCHVDVKASFETSRVTWHSVPEERSPQPDRCGKLKTLVTLQLSELLVSGQKFESD
jgi:hypothetical protein